jgi:acetylornithine deacetylase/succinyl-diaminopimelate desuccinylase-like protein
MALSLRPVRLHAEKAAEIAAVDALARNPQVARALQEIDRTASWTTEQQIRLTEIPAPTFQETARGAAVRRLFASSGLKTRVDGAGNVIGERPGESRKDVVLLSAHLDTVFPAGSEVKVRRDGPRLEAPGIADNGAGLAALVCLARVLQEAKVRTTLTLVLAANTGEEGEGNLRGMRKLVETYRGRLRAVIALDGAAVDHITTMALASRRFEITLVGPGGHSWADFGMPNPIHALARGVARFVETRAPDNPRTTYNVGVIEGGTSVNTIANRALVKVDMRSESETELDKLEALLRQAIESGVTEEMEAARQAGHPADPRIEIRYRALGSRPGGELPEDAPLLEAVRQADRYLDNRSHPERSSTDANIPLSLGIPAIAVGGGGSAGGAHSPGEWYDPAGRELGLKRILLTALAVAGVEP